jgi:hypothetical protein
MSGLSPTVIRNVGKTLGNMHYAGGCLERALVDCVAMHGGWPPADTEALTCAARLKHRQRGDACVMTPLVRMMVRWVRCGGVLYALEGGFVDTARRSQLLYAFDNVMQYQS